ncbi:MAG: hypothetical protein SOH58_01430 [Olsenella sp.]|jgi:hypothetical protein
MNPRVVAIVSEYLEDSMRETFGEMGYNPPVKVVPYKNFSTISEVYDEYARDADGFLVSGPIAMAAIREGSHELARPMLAFEADLSSLYRTLLDLILKDRDLDLTRVIYDYLIPVFDGCTAEYFLKTMDDAERQRAYQRWSRSLTSDDIRALEPSIVGRLKEMRERDELDVVVCQYSNIIPDLEQAGVPYVYPLPRRSYLSGLMEHLFSLIELERIRSSLPVCIGLVPKGFRRGEIGEQEALRRSAELARALGEFFHESLLDCEPEVNGAFCRVSTDVRVLQYLTEKGTVCKIATELADKVDFPFLVGYGVGVRYEYAVANSDAALREAARGGGSFIVNENGDMTGPLGTERRMVVENLPSGAAGRIARACHLNPATVNKVVAIMHLDNSNKITAQELAGHLGSTVRNASRILYNLEAGGYARQVSTGPGTKAKGRPVKVYEVLFDE